MTIYDEEILLLKISIVENLQVAIMDSGGRHFKWSELAELSLPNLLDILVKNNIEITTSYKGARS